MIDGPHARWRSLPPEGVLRERTGGAGSAAPSNGPAAVSAAAPATSGGVASLVRTFGDEWGKVHD